MDAFKIAVSAETGKLAQFIFLNHDYLSLSLFYLFFVIPDVEVNPHPLLTPADSACRLCAVDGVTGHTAYSIWSYRANSRRLKGLCLWSLCVLKLDLLYVLSLDSKIRFLYS